MSYVAKDLWKNEEDHGKAGRDDRPNEYLLLQYQQVRKVITNSYHTIPMHTITITITITNTITIDMPNLTLT